MSSPASDQPAQDATEVPRRVSPSRHANATATTNKRASAPAATAPKSAPATPSNGSPPKKKTEPSLLGDFFLGRQSPARVAALKQRRKSMAADAAHVREELRQEMRAAAVRRVQQPGGVTDRVKAWQKANVTAMKNQGGGIPHAEDVASEPTEVGAQISTQSVTEEDRVRIKMRKRPKKRRAKTNKPEDKESKESGEGDGDETERGGSASPSPEESPSKPPVVKLAPKKRIDWAQRVEAPQPQPVKTKQYRHRKSGATVTVEEDPPSVVTSDPGIETTKKPAQDDGIRVKPTRLRKPNHGPDDGIRVAPIRKKGSVDDGIRVRPIDTKANDDGIRVRPIDSPLEDKNTPSGARASTLSDDSSSSPTSSRRSSRRRRARASTTRQNQKSSPKGVVEVVEDPDTEVQTPTKRKPSRRRSRRRSPGSKPTTQATEPPADPASGSDKVPHVSVQACSDEDSEVAPPTVLGNKSLADIPFGYSAFSELELPLGADARNSASRKPRAQRNPSLKAVPNVLKKVVTGAKDMIQEMAEPPKPVVSNKPQSIESWLNDTVDPFVEPTARSPVAQEPVPKAAVENTSMASKSPEPAVNTQSKPPSRPSSRHVSRPPAGSQPVAPVESTVTKSSSSQESTEGPWEDSDVTPKKAKAPSPPMTGLKRRRATRAVTSPAKPSGKKAFRDLLKDAFRGESGGHKLPPMVYPSCETDDDNGGSEFEREDYESTTVGKGPPVSDYSSYYSSAYDSTLSSDLSSQVPYRSRPPTKGVHELSTIVSEESSAVGSEALSDVSQTTVTQTTAFTKSTSLSRRKSQKPGLKRRLTKHSDLVSVLSLPDDGQLVPPRRSKSIKSSHSLHRKPSRANKSKADELLDEFADDEHFYGRELKALVDGVIPVLLRDVMNGGADDLRSDAAVKSVVNMGMALEKLRTFHRQVPLSSITELLFWLDDVSPVYNGYLDVWRLGFQGLAINLAPKHGGFDDDDSLLNALPLNEEGDIIGENGERVDVAYLLRRPLIRVKWVVKFLRAAVAVTEAREAQRLLSVFMALQEKARKRHREETARLMDEDANSTDTSRCRDLRNLLPLDGVMVNRTRQVAALDVFSLDLDHSNGQRLGCQVEIIFRDRPSFPEDRGDILIRELGNGARSWLLFPPVPRQYISARLGDEDDDSLVVMIRGSHNGNEWFELLKISTNNEEQIDYWLRILGSHPIPPITRSRPASMVLGSASPKSVAMDVPVGERKVSTSSLGSSNTERPTTPSSRPRPRSPSDGSAAEECAEDHLEEHDDEPSWDSHSVDAPKSAKAPPNTKPYREDGAPPPPIHRTLGPKSSGLLAPPVDSSRNARLKRRMSSPLKHEYHPSDVSSDSSASLSESDSELSESSSDDLGEDDVPETIPGYSIKELEATPAESVASENSVTPSHSASQMEIYGPDDSKPERPAQNFVGSVSYWSSRRGVWKDVNNGQPASIVVHPGSMEVHYLDEQESTRKAYPLQSSGTSEIDDSNRSAGTIVPLVALVLTPVVMIRRSTALDLEVRSPASPEARLKLEATMFRFRAANQAEAKDLYDAVHNSRLNNARYIQLSEESRFRSFGQMQPNPGEGSMDGTSSRRTGWFGRKNSYRASTRAPSVSQGSISTTVSAGSFLRRLMGGGNNNSYNIDESTLDKPRPNSAALPGSGSLYTSSSGSGSGSGSVTPPRSASVSLSNSGSQSRWTSGFAKTFSPDQPLEIRCHLNVQNNRWLDKGDCILNISRPPPGVRQELPLYNGLEKRIIVTHATKKNADRPLILLDAVLGSKCFSLLGSKGVMCSVWENLRDEEGNVGVAPKSGAIAGKVTKWCFQCKSMQQAGWIMQLLTTEVPGIMMR
ncbi:uncharacterized protein C8A04DRAFT_8704 [Dichotomopilus funicola]|uniref:Uncharacterized protein n=1 Tax=Dichotomopilus funicola TaxID=1934379 RepID=A0AAN6ZSC1_9PEZI|nr:hypothetical protein C8A04DRAFT_8704 [Dichotomopilus funicola]